MPGKQFADGRCERDIGLEQDPIRESREKSNEKLLIAKSDVRATVLPTIITNITELLIYILRNVRCILLCKESLITNE